MLRLLLTYILITSLQRSFLAEVVEEIWIREFLRGDGIPFLGGVFLVLIKPKVIIILLEVLYIMNPAYPVSLIEHLFQALRFHRARLDLIRLIGVKDV